MKCPIKGPFSLEKKMHVIVILSTHSPPFLTGFSKVCVGWGGVYHPTHSGLSDSLDVFGSEGILNKNILYFLVLNTIQLIVEYSQGLELHCP